MPTLTTFRGEKSVSELSNKLFGRLTSKQKERVEEALLKANPQLGNIGNLRAGTILHVPNLPELRTKTRRTLENPDEQIAARLGDDLSAYDKRLAARRDSAQAQVAEAAKLLTDKALTKAIGDDPALKKLVAEIGKKNAERKETLSERRKAFGSVFKQMQKDLDGLS
jgi:Tfp pilus assembly protein FimV